MISRMTRITCCQMVKELRSTVTRPVPVAPLIIIYRESTNVIGNSPLLANRIVAPNKGMKTLGSNVKEKPPIMPCECVLTTRVDVSCKS